MSEKEPQQIGKFLHPQLCPECRNETLSVTPLVGEPNTLTASVGYSHKDCWRGTLRVRAGDQFGATDVEKGLNLLHAHRQDSAFLADLLVSPGERKALEARVQNLRTMIVNFLPAVEPDPSDDDLRLYLEGQADRITNLGAEIYKLKGWVQDLQDGGYVNCVYCGHRYGTEEDCTPVALAQVLKNHVEVCPKHPMSALKAELDGLKKVYVIMTGEAPEQRFVEVEDEQGRSLSVDWSSADKLGPLYYKPPTLLGHKGESLMLDRPILTPEGEEAAAKLAAEAAKQELHPVFLRVSEGAHSGEEFLGVETGDGHRVYAMPLSEVDCSPYANLIGPLYMKGKDFAAGLDRPVSRWNKPTANTLLQHKPKTMGVMDGSFVCSTCTHVVCADDASLPPVCPQCELFYAALSRGLSEAEAREEVWPS